MSGNRKENGLIFFLIFAALALVGIYSLIFMATPK
jgi:hypothetical protein